MLSGALEENILCCLCYDANHAPELAMRLTRDHFSTRGYQEIAEAAFKHIEQYNQPPGAHIRDIFEKQLTRGSSDGKLLKLTIDAMEKLAPTLQPSYVMEQLGRFIEKQELSNALEEAMEALSRDDIPQAREAMYAKAGQNTLLGPGTFLHDPDAALAFLNDQEESLFSTGIGVFDERNIRPRRKALLVFHGCNQFRQIMVCHQLREAGAT